MTSKQGGGSTAAPVFATLYKNMLELRPEMQRKFKIPPKIIKTTIDNKPEVFTEQSPVPSQNKLRIIKENEILF